MATLAGLQRKLEALRKSLAGAKGGLEKGRKSANQFKGEEWLDYTIGKLDDIHEEINKLKNYVNKVVGS